VDVFRSNIPNYSVLIEGLSLKDMWGDIHDCLVH
jgi:hypothetical protein